MSAVVLDFGLKPTPARAGSQPCGPAGQMLTKGLDAYSQSRYELAVPMFECVVRSDDALQKMHAEFFLARIFSDDTGGFVDHAEAYKYYQRISEAADTVDPEDTRRAPFVAKAVTAIAGYVRRGLPQIGLKSDLERAVEIYRTAATTFNEPDAQFELAKLHLTGTGVQKDIALSLHYFQKLVKTDGHAAAQAYLGDLYRSGNASPEVPKNVAVALALSKLAVENASASDRLWIEDSYQKVFCGASTAERTRAAAIASKWRESFARSGDALRPPPVTALGNQPRPSRTCGNGESIDMDLRGALTASPMPSVATQPTPQATTPAGLRAPAR